MFLWGGGGVKRGRHVRLTTSQQQTASRLYAQSGILNIHNPIGLRGLLRRYLYFTDQDSIQLQTTQLLLSAYQ
jgi:hypothetical protein